MLPASIACVAKAWYSIFFCAIELDCFPKTIKNTSMSHTAAVGDMFLHYVEHERCNLNQSHIHRPAAINTQ